MKIEKDGIDVCITFDTTGSMYPCLTQVRRNVEETVRRLFRDIPSLRIAVIAHGDYCDRYSSYVTKTLDFSGNVERICSFVQGVGRTNGGDSPECYELVLNEARSLNWTAGKSKVLVMIGDDVPHGKNYPENTNKIDWKNELELLREMGVNVYGVHAMPGTRGHSRWFYQEIAEKTNGYYLTLDQFAAITDIVFAICYKQSGDGSLNNFQQEVQNAHRMNRNMANVFGTLSGIAIKIESTVPGLVPVSPGRFQVINVEKEDMEENGRCKIKNFVLNQGLEFKVGRGFYEFMKSEVIQEKKEVVLLDNRTGDMFSGDEARIMIGLPFGRRGKIKPASIAGYTVFVQSTSWNRNLIAGTRFLYEVDDWDKYL